MLSQNVKNDVELGSTLNAETSPKTTYTFLLFGLEREFFSMIISNDISDERIADGFSCLVGFCPDRPIRENLWKTFARLKSDGNSTRHAAILALGDLTDYLAECLDLTDSSIGGFL